MCKCYTSKLAVTHNPCNKTSHDSCRRSRPTWSQLYVTITWHTYPMHHYAADFYCRLKLATRNFRFFTFCDTFSSFCCWTGSIFEPNDLVNWFNIRLIHAPVSTFECGFPLIWTWYSILGFYICRVDVSAQLRVWKSSWTVVTTYLQAHDK